MGSSERSIARSAVAAVARDFEPRPIVYTNWKDGRTPRAAPSLVRGSRRTLPRLSFTLAAAAARPQDLAHRPQHPRRGRAAPRSRAENPIAPPRAHRPPHLARLL